MFVWVCSLSSYALKSIFHSRYYGASCVQNVSSSTDDSKKNDVLPEQSPTTDVKVVNAPKMEGKGIPFAKKILCVDVIYTQ